MQKPLMQLQPVVLEGAYVRLEPLSHAHLEGLCEAGLDAELWHWTPHAVRSRADMQRYLEQALEGRQRGEMLPFAILASSTGSVAGSTRYGAIDRQNRRVEIGWTWVARAWQRTPVNTEAKYLLLRYAFEQLGCLRVEFKTDARNERSRSALLRIGAQEEGTLRRHMLTESGRVRDTVYFSILDTEWLCVKAELERKLEQA